MFGCCLWKVVEKCLCCLIEALIVFIFHWTLFPLGQSCESILRQSWAKNDLFFTLYLILCFIQSKKGKFVILSLCFITRFIINIFAAKFSTLSLITLFIVFVWSQYDGVNIEQKTIGYGWRQNQEAKLKSVRGAMS